MRDLANDHDSLQAVVRAINAGNEIGPRIVTAGFIDGRGPYAEPTKQVCSPIGPDTMAAGYGPIADRLPPQVRRGLLIGGLAVPEGKDQTYRGSSQALLRMIKLLHDRVVTLVVGTDSMPGFTLHFAAYPW